MRHAGKILTLVFALSIAASVAGCSGGVGTTNEDVKRHFVRVVEYDQRMMVDDVATFCQTDRTFRGSRYILD